LFAEGRDPVLSRKIAWKYTTALSIPLLAVLILAVVRSDGVFPLSSPLQITKNLIVSTSHLFYNFKPFGFTGLFTSPNLTVNDLLLFIMAHPSLPIMLGISSIFGFILLLLIRYGDHQVRFLCIGIVLNTLLFSLYVGISPRFLSFSVLFVSGLCAYLYSKAVKPSRWLMGLILFAVLVGCDLHLLHSEKRPFVEQIRYVEALRNELASPEEHSLAEPILIDRINVIEELKKFWKL